MKKIIAIDMDGVLAEYHGWKGVTHIGEPIRGSQGFIQELMDKGYNVVIYTTRMSPSANKGYPTEVLKKFLQEWLEKNNFPESIEIWSEPGKPIASVYIDDRAYYKKPNTPWAISDMKNVVELAK